MNTLRSLVWAALGIAAISLVGCGGGSSSPSGNASSGSGSSGNSGSGSSGTGSTGTTNALTGVAASGDPLAGAKVTLKDQNGNTQTATTASDGSFSVNVTGLTAPFLLQVVSADGTTTYYSASASAASSNPTANLDQYTDLAIRTYFAALNGSEVSTVFADVSAATVMPAQADLNNLSGALNNALQPTMLKDGVASAASFDIFSTAFTANETGFDALLHDTTYTSASSPTSAASYTLSTPGANGEVLTENGTVTISAGQISFNNTNTDATSGSTTASTSTFSTVSVAATTAQQQTDEAAAVAGIQKLWSQLVATAQTDGSALSASDLAPYFDTNFLEDGTTAATSESTLAQRLEAYVATGQASGSIGQIYSFSDSAGSPIQIDAQPLLSVSANSVAYSVDLGQITGTSGGQGLVFIQESDGSYALYGNQNIAQTTFHIETTNVYNNEGQSQPITSTELQLTAGAPPNIVSTVAIANTGSNALLPDCTGGPGPFTLTQAAPPILLAETTSIVGDINGEPGEFFNNATCGLVPLYVPTTSFPPSGTEYLVTYIEPGGATQSTAVTMNSQSSDTLPLQSINGENPDTFLSTAGNLTGASLSLSWPLPTTFAVRAITVAVDAVSGSSITNISTTDYSPIATSGTAVLPSTAANEFIVIVAITGNDGEEVEDEIELLNQ